MTNRHRYTFDLTDGEIQSKLNRLHIAEGLIKQLPEGHDGRNTWLLNYGGTKGSTHRVWESAPPATKFCIDCKHCIMPEGDTRNALMRWWRPKDAPKASDYSCGHITEQRGVVESDLVSWSCVSARSHHDEETLENYPEYCGVRARYFEPRDYERYPLSRKGQAALDKLRGESKEGVVVEDEDAQVEASKALETVAEFGDRVEEIRGQSKEAVMLDESMPFPGDDVDGSPGQSEKGLPNHEAIEKANMRSNTIKHMPIKEFRAFGWLQEINRRMLHPAGLAMSVRVDDKGNETLDGVWDYRDDPEGIYYLKDTADPLLAREVDKAIESHYDKRVELFGDVIQPVDEA